jgi:hypothetical protein
MAILGPLFDGGLVDGLKRGPKLIFLHFIWDQCYINVIFATNGVKSTVLEKSQNITLFFTKTRF